MKLRVLTAVLLIPIVLGVVLCTSPWPFLGVLFLILVLGSDEAGRLFPESKTSVLLGGILLGLLAGVAVSLYPDAAGRADKLLYAGLAVGLTLVGVLIALGSRAKWTLALVGGWIAGPCVALILLHTLAPASPGLFQIKAPILLTLLPLWGGDTAAIFAGKAFGKHLLAPSISPKKTWEGSIANLAVCLAVAIPLALWLGYGPIVGVGCGLATGIFGQAGDLFQSSLKRRANVKDSGTLLPGHGGILDRIDSLLFAAPLVALILSL